MLGDRVVERKPSLVSKHEQRSSHERLRHRADPGGRITPGSLVLSHVQRSDTGGVDELAAEDQPVRDPGHLIALGDPREVIVERAERRLVHYACLVIRGSSSIGPPTS